MKLESEVKIYETLFNLQLALSDIIADHFRIKLGIQEMLQARLSLDIVPNEILLGLLNNISLKEPGLLFPARPEYLALYRDIIKVVPRGYKSAVCFYLLIPVLGDPSDVFDIFRITSLPYSVPETNYFVKVVNTVPFIAFTQDRLHYMLFEGFKNCRDH